MRIWLPWGDVTWPENNFFSHYGRILSPLSFRMHGSPYYCKYHTYQVRRNVVLHNRGISSDVVQTVSSTPALSQSIFGMSLDSNLT